MSPLKIIEQIYNYKITLNEAIEKQAELKELINKLNNNYNPRNTKKKKKRSFRICKKNCWMREKILLIFLKKEFFHIKVMYLKEKKKNKKKNQKKN